MKHAGRRAWVSMIAITFTLIILAVLFTVPRRYIIRVTNTMDGYAADAIEAVFDADWERTLNDMQLLEREFDGMRNTSKLFLNHEDIDELEASIAAAWRLAQINDDAELLIQLERIRNTLDYLRGIETFDWVDLF